MSKDITLEKANLQIEEGLAILTLSDAEHMNVMGYQMGADLKTLAGAIAEDTSLRALLIRAEGKHFCGGGDLKAMQEGFEVDPKRFFEVALVDIHAAVRILGGLPIPIVCAVQGYAAGAGANFALLADIVLIGDTTTFFQAFTQVGVAVDSGGSWFLPRAIGEKRAMYLLMTGAKVSGLEAVLMGMASKVVPEEELQQEARALADRLATGPTTAYRQIKRLVSTYAQKDLNKALTEELAAQIACGQTGDFVTGVNAFLAKEPASFAGR